MSNIKFRLIDSMCCLSNMCHRGENFDLMSLTGASNRWMVFIGVSSQVVGLIAVILIAVLMGKYQGGFGWGVSSFQCLTNKSLLLV